MNYPPGPGQPNEPWQPQYGPAPGNPMPPQGGVPGYPQPPSFGPPAAPGGPGGYPPPRKPVWPWIMVVVLVLVAALGGAGFLAFKASDDDSDEAQTSSSSSASATSSTRMTPATPTETTQPKPTAIPDAPARTDADPDGAEVTYEVTSDGEIIMVLYDDASGNSQNERSPSSPWQTSITTTSGTSAVSMGAFAGSGEITCKITVNGTVETEKTVPSGMAHCMVFFN